MSQKVLVTSGPFMRAAADPRTGYAMASEILTSAGIELVLLVKKEAGEYKFSDFEGLMPGINGVIAGSEPWKEELFKISKDLKIISRYGVGYDAVDLAKAKEYGIMVTNTRVAELSKSVAECALGLAMSVEKNLATMSAEMKRGEWNRRPGRLLMGMTFGIVGFGAIGQFLAKLLSGFDARILSHDPFGDPVKAGKLGVELVSFEQLLVESDVVSLHAPNTMENRHLFNARTFAKMKKGAIFVNTARGPLVDEKALYDTLVSGHLYGAGIDVWETEPTPAGNPLLTLNNVVALPHAAGETDASATAIATRAAMQVKDALAGKTPVDVLNP